MFVNAASGDAGLGSGEGAASPGCRGATACSQSSDGLDCTAQQYVCSVTRPEQCSEVFFNIFFYYLNGCYNSPRVKISTDGAQRPKYLPCGLTKQKS